MTTFESFLLRADTAIICLALIIYFFKSFNREKESNIESTKKPTNSELAADFVISKQGIQNKTGSTKGEAQIIGLDNDEVVCAIIAAVSSASKIPIDSLKIKSIKAIEK